MNSKSYYKTIIFFNQYEKENQPRHTTSIIEFTEKPYFCTSTYLQISTRNDDLKYEIISINLPMGKPMCKVQVVYEKGDLIVVLLRARELNGASR